MHDIEDYRQIIGDELFFNLFKKAGKCTSKTVLNINSTAQGGGGSRNIRISDYPHERAWHLRRMDNTPWEPRFLYNYQKVSQCFTGKLNKPHKN